MIGMRKCPVHGIEGARGLFQVIDRDPGVRCGTRFEACSEKFEAISMVHEPVPPFIPEGEGAIKEEGREGG